MVRNTAVCLEILGREGPGERPALVMQDEGLDRWYLGITRIPVLKAAEALGIQFAQAL